MLLAAHYTVALQAKLDAGIGVDAVVYAVVAGMLAAGHAVVGGVDYGIALKSDYIAPP